MRFLSAFVERQHHRAPRDIGLVLGPVLGSCGVLSGFAAGHLVDRCYRRWRTLRVNLPLGMGKILKIMGKSRQDGAIAKLRHDSTVENHGIYGGLHQ